jgi:hypothetical protein
MGIVGRLDQYGSMLTSEFDEYSMSENLLLRSNSFSTAGTWTQVGAACVFTQNVTGPDNVSNSAWTIDDQSVASDAAGFEQTKSITPSTTTNYCLSVFAKQGTSTTFDFYAFFTGTSTRGSYIRYNFSTNTLTASAAEGPGITPTIYGKIEYPNGWYRFYFVVNDANSGLNSNLQFRVYPATRNISVTGTTLFYGAQLEIGTGPTDYTSTTTTAISRVLASTTNTNITGLSTYFSSGFSENVGAATTLVANVFPPYQIVYDEFAGTLFGSGQGRLMRQNIDKSVIVYNEIDEVSDFYSRGVVRAGLVLDLDAGVSSSYPGTGTTWTDLSPYGNNGTLTLGPTYSSANGGSIVFDGSNDFTGSFTQSAWIYKLNNNQIWQGVFTNSSPATSNTYLMTFGNGSLQAPYNSVGVNQVGVVADGVFLDIGTHINRWLYIIITKVGSTLNIYCYKDGSLLQTSGTITWNSGNFATTNNYEIGRHWAGGSVVPLQGNVAQVSVYNRALTAAEIKQNYDATKGRFGL